MDLFLAAAQHWTLGGKVAATAAFCFILACISFMIWVAEAPHEKWFGRITIGLTLLGTLIFIGEGFVAIWSQ